MPYFFNSRREVLNEQLAQVVEGLEFAGLDDRQMERRLDRQTSVDDVKYEAER